MAGALQYHQGYDQSFESSFNTGKRARTAIGRRAVVLSALSDTGDVAKDLGSYAKGLWINVAGTITVIAAGDKSNGGLGTPVAFKIPTAGMLLPVEVRQVCATGTVTIAAGDVILLGD